MTATVAFTIGGLVFGLFFTVVSGVIIILAGDFTTHEGRVVPLLLIVQANILGGLAGGFLIGLFRRLLFNVWGAFVVGMMGWLPLFALSGWAYEGSWIQIDWLLVAFGTLAVGGPIGLVVRREYLQTLDEFGWSHGRSRNSHSR